MIASRILDHGGWILSQLEQLVDDVDVRNRPNLRTDPGASWLVVSSVWVEILVTTGLGQALTMSADADVDHAFVVCVNHVDKIGVSRIQTKGRFEILEETVGGNRWIRWMEGWMDWWIDRCSDGWMD